MYFYVEQNKMKQSDKMASLWNGEDIDIDLLVKPTVKFCCYLIAFQKWPNCQMRHVTIKLWRVH